MLPPSLHHTLSPFYSWRQAVRAVRQPFIRLVRAAGNTIPNSNEKPILHSVSLRDIYVAPSLCIMHPHTHARCPGGSRYRWLCVTDKATFAKWATSARCLFDYRLNRRLSTRPKMSLCLVAESGGVGARWRLQRKLNIETSTCVRVVLRDERVSVGNISWRSRDYWL